jgi:hypothetical protein
MLSKRVIVIASDKPLQKRLVAGAMAAGAAVQACDSTDELPPRFEAALILYATGWSISDPAFTALKSRLPEACRLVPVIPAPQLESMVSLLADSRTPSALVAEELTVHTVSSAVSKILYGDLFGLEKVMPWGVRIYSLLVGDYHEKSNAISSVGDFASAMGVRRKYREQIDQCLDEMLMNALYDAPVDDDGNPLFAAVPIKERVALRVEEKAVVQYACDGERFAVSVRDTFGSLERDRILQVLDKCLHAPPTEQIDRQDTSRTGGAGLGLYLIANGATELYFHIFNGRATEVVVTFDLQAARSQLRSFGIYEEELANRSGVPSPSGIRTIPRPGRRREDLLPKAPPPSRALAVMMPFSVLLLLVAVGLAAWPYVHGPTHVKLHVESDPPGAAIFVDGRSRGTAPIDVTDLEAGRSYAVRGALKGHRDDDQLVVATAGSSTVRLHLGNIAGVIALDCDPPGAHVIVDGKDIGRLTPTNVELEPQKTVTIRLRKQGYRDRELTVTGPAPGERAVYQTSLPLSPEVAGLRIEVSPPTAAVAIDGLALMPPAPEHDEFIKPGALHHVKVSAPGYIDFREDVYLAGGEHKSLRVKLALGGVLALKTNTAAKVFVDDKAVGTAPLAPLALAEGKHTLTLKSDKPALHFFTNVEVEKGKTNEQRIDFGIVEVKASGVTARVDGFPDGVTVLQLPVGPQKIALYNASGEKKEREVVVASGRRIVIDSF